MKSLPLATIFAFAGLVLSLARPAPAQAAGPATPAPQDAAAEEGEPMLLHKPDGDVVVGHLLDHDANGFRFRVARHGGVVSLAWNRLHPDQTLALQKRFGYVEEETQEILIPGDILILVDGTERVGVILERQGANFVMKSEGNTIVVPKARVVSVNQAGRIPALDVYKTDELYAQGLSRLQQEDPLSHVELAEFCERIFDFPHAVQHYTQAVLLARDNEDTSAWQVASERAAVKAEQADQLDRLREVDRLRRRSYFPQALEKIAAFRAAYKDSPLLADANKAEALVVKTQERVLRERIAKRWFYRVNQLTRQAARAKGTNLAALTQVMDSTFQNQVRTAVTNDVQDLMPGIAPEVVEELFTQRKKGRYRVATYGSGTWLLGSDRAQAGLKDKEKQKSKPVALSAGDATPETDYQKRVQAYLENQQRLARAGLRAGGEEVEERQKSWQSMSLNARHSWLVAYYAEFSGFLETKASVAHLCRQCGGTGALESINAGLPQSQSGAGRGRGRQRTGAQGAGGPRIERCTLCHGEQIVRRVRYR